MHERRVEMLHRQVDGTGTFGLADDAARHAIARRQVARRLVARHERLALGVQQPRAFAAQRLGQQESRLARQHQGRRVELHELEIGNAGAAAVRHRHAVAGRHRRIRRIAIDVARAAGREQHRLRPRHPHAPIVGQELHAGAPAALDEQVDDAGVRVRPDAGHGRDAPVENAADLAAGRIPRVQHTTDAVRAFDGQRELPVGTAIEARAPLHQLADESRPVLDERMHGALVAQAVAGGKRVGGVESRRIAGTDRCGNPALGMAGIAFVWLGLGQDQDLACGTEFRGRAQARDATADDEVVCAQVHAVSDPAILDQSRHRPGRRRVITLNRHA